MNSKLENIDLHDIIFIVKKNMLLIILITIAFGTLGFLTTKFVITPQYQAEAKMIVNTASVTADAAQIYDAVELSQKEVDTYAIVMKSNTILGKVIKDLNLGITKDQLSGKIDIDGVGTTEVLDLKVKDASPAMAKAIAAEIIKYSPAEIIRTVKAGSVEVISQPVATNKPVSPNLTVNTALSLVLGIVISVIIAFLIEMLNSTFTNADDVRKYLNYTVIGVIPNVDFKRKSESRK